MATNWGAIAQAGLGLASQYAGARAASQQQAQMAQQDQNRTAVAQNQGQNNVLLQMAQIELLRKQMQEQNRPQRAQATALGDSLANVQDVSISRPSHITNFSVSGGLRPSALGPNARAAGQELSAQSLAALKGGDSFMPLNMTGPIDLDATMPKESAFDQIMALAGAVGNTYQGMQQRKALEQQLQAAGQQQPVANYAEILKLMEGYPRG